MQRRDDGFYDFPVDFEEALVENGMVDELFYLKELTQRKLFLNGDIDQFSTSDISKHIMQYNAEDKGIDVSERKPIILYITSHGGDVDAGFSLIDIIKSSKTPVYTVNIGYEYSMAFLVGLAGHKRFATKNSRFLLHDGSSIVYGSGCKIQDQMDFQRRENQRIKDYVTANSSVTEKEYNKKVRFEWYMFADEAKANGFTDCIIGEDCDIDSIV